MTTTSTSAELPTTDDQTISSSDEVTTGEGSTELVANQTEITMTEIAMTENDNLMTNEIVANTTQEENDSNGLFANLDANTWILIGGIAAAVLVVLVVVSVIIIYIRCKSRGRRQVNVAPNNPGEHEGDSRDTVPLT